MQCIYYHFKQILLTSYLSACAFVNCVLLVLLYARQIGQNNACLLSHVHFSKKRGARTFAAHASAVEPQPAQSSKTSQDNKTTRPHTINTFATFLLTVHFSLQTQHKSMPAIPPTLGKLARRALITAGPALAQPHLHQLQRRGLSVNHTQGVTLGVLIAYIVIIAILWNVPYIRWVLWPFKVNNSPHDPRASRACANTPGRC